MIRAVKKRWGLAFSLTSFLFVMMASAMLLTFLAAVTLDYFGILNFEQRGKFEQAPDISPFRFIFNTMFFSVFLGIVITAFFSKRALQPIRGLIAAIHKVAAGDFNIQVKLKGVNELEELSDSFNKMTLELLSIETMRRDFINNVSHEFKTPIVSIRGFAKQLKYCELTEAEKQEYLDIIITESERLAQLSTNILNLSKYDTIEIITEKIPFRLDEQIRRAIVLTEPAWTAKEITFNVEMGEIVFEGNEDLTQQIWLNLIDNAVKFSSQGGIINVCLSRRNERIRFAIQDNGIGIDDKAKAHIFEKFYQGDTSHSKTGNGLGLAIVKRIIKLHGGDIELQSGLGKGSTFVVFL